MQVTLGNVSVLLGVSGVILYATRRIIQFLDILCLMAIDWSEATGRPLPGWIVDEYKRISKNGEHLTPREDKSKAKGARE